METEENREYAKRMKPSMEAVTEDDEDAVVKNSGEVTEGNPTGSEQMLAEIAHIHEKIHRFTQLVSELLESGKSMLKEMSNEFEEKMILIHKEQIDKWQEEIQELHLIDASNEEINAVLQNAKGLLQNVSGES